ncbi:hypothetical protein DVH24_019687 [Malus domestica]|uniref:Uncharacterized protein n=1 Tax=Malus domestica TaxID=3750 RepID=A0A498I1K7_MALDO|nr:hypothetical protein DVH24_019687 [Malus domestica]
MTSTLSPMTTPIIAATTLAEMDHRLVNSVDLFHRRRHHQLLQAQASSTSLVALLVSARRTHRRPCTTDQMSPSGSTTDASGTRPCIQS